MVDLFTNYSINYIIVRSNVNKTRGDVNTVDLEWDKEMNFFSCPWKGCLRYLCGSLVFIAVFVI